MSRITLTDGRDRIMYAVGDVITVTPPGMREVVIGVTHAGDLLTVPIEAMRATVAAVFEPLLGWLRAGTQRPRIIRSA